MLTTGKIVSAIFMLFPILSNEARAEKYIGRITFGGYAAQEKFSDDVSGSDRNDVLFFSSRFFFKTGDPVENDWEFTSDFRDKNDFFDKLDRENLTLTNRNDFQINSLFAHYGPLGSTINFDLGRFHLPEAGAPGVDGAQFTYRWSSELRTSFFGGKNPKRPDQVYYQFNPNDNLAGAAATYQGRTASWYENRYMSMAYLTQTEQGVTTRTYLFENSIYQWEEYSRIMSLLYLDFVPRSYIQTGNVIWQQQYSPSLYSEVGATAIDVITYSHVQSVLEQLPSSPYKEGNAKIDFFFQDRKQKLELATSYGTREADSKTRSESYIGLEENKVLSRNQDVFLKFGYRKNFVSNDIFLRGYWGYFSRNWEGALDLEVGSQTFTDGTNVVYHPIVASVSLSNYWTKELFSTVSFERAANEQVAVYTLAFKLGYRFGNQEVAPVRDGSPPRGQL